MSFRHLRAVFKMQPVWSNPSEFAVLTVLANFANHDGEAWPSQATIGRLIGVKSAKQVARLTRALEDLELIHIDRGVSSRGGCCYTLLFDAATPPASVQSEERTTPRANVHSGNGDSGHFEPVTPDIRAVDSGHFRPGLPPPVSTDPKDPVQKPVQTTAPEPNHYLTISTAAKQLLKERPRDFVEKCDLNEAIRAVVGHGPDGPTDQEIDIASQLSWFAHRGFGQRTAQGTR